MKTKNLVVQYRRKRQGKTDYRLRLQLLLSQKPRLVVRKSLRHINAQLVQYREDGDILIVAAHSKMLQKLGWKHSTRTVPAAYLTGLLLGRKAQNIKTATADLGLQQSVKGGRLYAVIKGARDAGLQIPCSKEMLPDDERIQGKHLKTELTQDIAALKNKMLGKADEKKN